MHAALLLSLGLLGCTSTPKDAPLDSDPVAGCEAIDEDEDGVDSCTDCNDSDPAIHPGASERCNGVDDNCDEVLGWMEDDLSCQACDQAGYWVPLDGLSGPALQDALFDLISEHRCSDYSNTTTWMFVNLDKRDGEVECVYTGRTTPVGSRKPDATDMNTEHTWPQSQGADRIPAKCDLNHLFPTDSGANNKRGSLPFGVVVGGSSWSVGGSSVGEDGAGSQVFEPRDAHKGDVARAMLYFSIRYRDELADAEVDAMLTGRDDLFRQWHADDPPTALDVARSQEIAAFQGAGNPLVLCPDVVSKL